LSRRKLARHALVEGGGRRWSRFDVLLDLDGSELPTEGVAQKALASARDCIAGELHDGRVDFR
jgi:hypothetical protein